MEPNSSFDDYMRLADLAEGRNAGIEARAYLKAAMLLALDRAEPYWRLGSLWEKEGDQKLAAQYYYMAINADHNFERLWTLLETDGAATMPERAAS